MYRLRMILVCIALTVTASVVHAEARRVTSTVDSTTVYYTYTEGQRYLVTTYTGHVTTIVLPEGEVVAIEPAVGIEGVWQVNQLAPNILAVRPLLEIGRSNMNVVTETPRSDDRRHYIFDLTIQATPRGVERGGALPQDMMLNVTFRNSSRERQTTSVARAADQVRTTAPSRTERSQSVVPTEPRFPTFKSVKKKAQQKRYGRIGDPRLAPVEAFDNGKFTFLRFSPDSDLPIITRLDMEGIEHVVTYRPDASRRERDTLIVEGVYPVLVLHYGTLSAAVVNMEKVPHATLAIAGTPTRGAMQTPMKGTPSGMIHHSGKTTRGPLNEQR